MYFVSDLYAIAVTSAFITLWLAFRPTASRGPWFTALLVAAATGILWEVFHGVVNWVANGSWTGLHAYGISHYFVPVMHVVSAALIAFPASLVTHVLLRHKRSTMQE
jgi:hypothetical protein